MAENHNNKQPSNPSAEWLLAIILLFTVWPVGLFLLIRLLSSGSIGNKRTTATKPPFIPKRGPIDVEAREIKSKPPQRSTAQTAPPQAPPSPEEKPQQKKETTPPVGKRIKSAGTLLTVFGTLLLAFGALSLSDVGSGLVASGFRLWQNALPELLFCLGAISTGFVLVRFGFSRRKRVRRLRKYLSLIGKRDNVPIDSLAKAMPVSYKKACDDLQAMLDDGVFPFGYLDLARGRLILSDAGIVDEPPPKVPNREPVGESGILRQIQDINDAIEDPVMSEKIQRIQEITARILEYQKQNPGRDNELRSFLDYYLPTTLKLLRSYVQLDAQGVDGANISASKSSIEGSMDKVVSGFETRLDKLFQSEALDISSDIAVLEQMLRKDGLSQDDELKIHIDR